jgi:mannose/fructose/N-acetylgalactosamine-specific phosphotransferase system component IID
VIIGVTVAKEQERSEKGMDAVDVNRLKMSMMGPFAALGDSLFWSTLRPLCSYIGAICVFFWGIWGPILFCLLYNLFQLPIRYIGFLRGYKFKEAVIMDVKRFPIQKLIEEGRIIGMVMLGVGIIGVLSIWGLVGVFGFNTWVLQASSFLIMCLLIFSIKRGINFITFFFTLCIVCFLIGALL